MASLVVGEHCRPGGLNWRCGLSKLRPITHDEVNDPRPSVETIVVMPCSGGIAKLSFLDPLNVDVSDRGQSSE